MQTFFYVVLAFLLSFAAVAYADRPPVTLRLVAPNGQTELPTHDGGRLRLGPPVGTGALEITQATVHGNEVQLELAPSSAKALAEVTARNHGRRLAIVVGGVVESTPVIRDAIIGGRVSITLRSAEDAQQLARALSAK